MSRAEMEKFISTAVPPLEDTRVVDTDVHIKYNEEIRREVARYMDKPYRNYVDPDTTADSYPSHGWPKSLGGARKFNLLEVASPQELDETLMQGFGVDNPIINIFSPIDKVLKTERAVAEARAINDFMLDHFLDENDDIYGLATVAARDPEAAAEEIDRLGDEEQIVGAYFALCEEFNEPMGDPSYDVMYQAMEDNDMTPAYHITGIHRKAPVLRELETVAAWHNLGPIWSAQHAITSLVFQGVPEKFPDLDFVMLEGGLGAWIPGMMARMNREYAQWRSELPLLEQSPEEYLRDQFYFGTQPMDEFNDPDHMRQVIDMIGADSLVFATDFPHYDFDHRTRCRSSSSISRTTTRRRSSTGTRPRYSDSPER
ncbi:amidohydrolase family protein [Haloplanus sp. GCM10025708]|uniref:amidohydrolase family protein n=1 Tax=Haloplanus sp. GCM10025708 TaxID=3252679 RepID=UPI003612F718